MGEGYRRYYLDASPRALASKCRLCRQTVSSKGAFLHRPSSTCAMCCGYFDLRGSMCVDRLPTYRCERCRMEQRIGYPTPYAARSADGTEVLTPWTWACNNGCFAQRHWVVVRFGIAEVAAVTLQSQMRAIWGGAGRARAVALRRARQELYLLRALFARGVAAPPAASPAASRADANGVAPPLTVAGACSIAARLPAPLLRVVLRFSCIPPSAAMGVASGAGAAATRRRRRQQRQQRVFQVGQLASLSGLQSAAELNGSVCRLVAWLEDRGRFRCIAERDRSIAVRPANLRHLDVPAAPAGAS